MATSPLVAATKPVGSSAEEQTPAEANYQVAMQRILDALDAREGRNQQDIYLALAQGMLTPGKTGSFGESVGQAAGSVREVQRQQDKEALENAQMRLQIAQAGREQEQLLGAQKAFRQKTGAGAPAAGGAQGAQGTTPDMKTVSLQDAMEFVAAFPNQKELGARMMEAAKAGLDRYSISMNGIVFDKMTGKYLNADIPGQTQSDYATPYGTYKMLPNEYSRFTMAQKAGMGKEWMDAFKKGEHFGVDQIVAQKLEGKPVGGLPATPSAVTKPATETTTQPAPSASTTTEGGRLTTSEQEARAAKMKAEAEAAGTGAGKRTSQAMDNVTAALDSKNTALQIKELAGQEGMSDVLGLFERPTVKAALAGMIENGKFVPDDIRSAAVKLSINLPKKAEETPQQYQERRQGVLDRYYQALSLMAQLQFGASMLAKGQGAISNNERELFAATTISKKDTYDTLMRKADMIIARAQFAQDLAGQLEDTNMSLDKFKRTTEYKNMEKAYENQLRRIWNPQAKTGAPNLDVAKERLNDLLKD